MLVLGTCMVSGSHILLIFQCHFFEVSYIFIQTIYYCNWNLIVGQLLWDLNIFNWDNPQKGLLYIFATLVHEKLDAMLCMVVPKGTLISKETLARKLFTLSLEDSVWPNESQNAYIPIKSHHILHRWDLQEYAIVNTEL